MEYLRLRLNQLEKRFDRIEHKLDRLAPKQTAQSEPSKRALFSDPDRFLAALDRYRIQKGFSWRALAGRTLFSPSYVLLLKNRKRKLTQEIARSLVQQLTGGSLQEFMETSS